MLTSTATRKSVNRLKEHLDMMKQELNMTNKQIKQLENKNTTEWESLDKVGGRSIDDLRQHENDIAKEIVKIQKEIKKSRSKTLLIAELAVLPAIFLLIFMSGVTDNLLDSPQNQVTQMKSRYFTENLKGDTVDVWKSWRLTGTTLTVNILKSPRVTDHQLDVIHNAVTSEKTAEFDDSIVHKGPRGSSSVYYQGWAGALKSATNENTEYRIPTNFDFTDTQDGVGDIIITLSNIKDSDGYTGYTKSITEENEILKSFITIYDISNLTDDQLATIVRHEFGHALGLGHSTAPEDLMAPTIDMTIPYISECNVDAIVDLYNANEGKQTVCKK
ncbi:MAG: hypothetical protein HW420_229 [Candidatus Nitrosotenuis sp.]|nr:hypothetical protein [Candidatus Nitrosotenuis sp.]